tara:strand:+ start:288 stop:488 length:201 start_codon:yes stop_codon:yes gene_type:complete
MCTKICAKEPKKYKLKNVGCLSTYSINTITRKPRCLKLKYRKLSHMFGLSNLNAWDNPPIAPPYSN